MGKARDIVIFKKAYDLSLDMFRATKLFPKSQRFLMANRVEELMVGILEKIVHANEAQDKLSILKGLSALLERLRILIRLSKNLAYIDFKKSLKEKFYLRYADDFVVLNKKLKPLQETKQKIEAFLRQSLYLELNPDKTKIISTNKGVDLLGYKIFYFYRLIRKRNLKRFKTKLKMWQEDIKQGRLSTARLSQKIKGWVEYARYANSYKLRKKLLSKYFWN